MEEHFAINTNSFISPEILLERAEKLFARATKNSGGEDFFRDIYELKLISQQLRSQRSQPVYLETINQRLSMLMQHVNTPIKILESSLCFILFRLERLALQIANGSQLPVNSDLEKIKTDCRNIEQELNSLIKEPENNPLALTDKIESDAAKILLNKLQHVKTCIGYLPANAKLVQQLLSDTDKEDAIVLPDANKDFSQVINKIKNNTLREYIKEHLAQKTNQQRYTIEEIEKFAEIANAYFSATKDNYFFSEFIVHLNKNDAQLFSLDRERFEQTVLEQQAINIASHINACWENFESISKQMSLTKIELNAALNHEARLSSKELAPHQLEEIKQKFVLLANLSESLRFCRQQLKTLAKILLSDQSHERLAELWQGANLDAQTLRQKREILLAEIRSNLGQAEEHLHQIESFQQTFLKGFPKISGIKKSEAPTVASSPAPEFIRDSADSSELKIKV